MNENFSKADEIKKMKDLLDSGAITQDEFEQQKARLLETEQGINPTVNPASASIPPLPQRKKNKGCLLACLIVLIVFSAVLVMTAVLAMRISQSDSLSQASTSSSAEGTQENWRDFDKKTWSDFEKLYVNHNAFMKNIEAFSAGNVDALTFYNSCKEAEEYFRTASTKFGYGTTDDEKIYLQAFEQAALEDQMAAKAAIKYIDKQNMSDLSEAQEHIATAKETIVMIASNRGKLLVKAGYTDEEIKTKVTEEMEALEAKTGQQ